MLPLIEQLLARLDNSGIPYCHWKSSSGLLEALRGETDLDLLVADAAADEFAAVVRDLGFKRFDSHPSRRMPGVDDWLGLEPSVPHLVHLHVYRRLILGEDHIKNHHLPVEYVLLRETERRHGIPVPRPEIELAILAVRGLLKYREGAYLRDALGIGRRGGLEPSILAEVEYLLARTTPAAVLEAVERHFPMLPVSVISEFLATAQRAPRDAQTLLRLRLQLEHSLRPYARHGFWTTSARRIVASAGRSRAGHLVDRLGAAVRRRPNGRRKTVAMGGRTMAIVGIDGSGKSTLVAELVRLLSWRVNVATTYLGSARPSPTTRVVQAAADMSQRGEHWLEREIGETRSPTKLARRITLLATGVRAIAEAADRRRRAVTARRLADRGWIVLLDRYPLPQVVLLDRRMDAWRLQASVRGYGWLLNRLGQRERAIYRGMPLADGILVLQIDPAVARARKPDLGVALDAKADALARWTATKPDRVVVVNAADSLDAVKRAAAVALWKLLP